MSHEFHELLTSVHRSHFSSGINRQVYPTDQIHSCENFKFCGRTFEKRLQMHNHYKNCMIERVCPICRTRPSFKSESGFCKHAQMHKVSVVRFH